MAAKWPAITSHRVNAGEILDSRSDIRCRRWHPAKTPGALRFVSLALHNPSTTGAEGIAGTFQRGSFQMILIRKRNFSTASLQNSTADPATVKVRSVQQAWMNSRNLKTIATDLEHRQAEFLHPTLRHEKCTTSGRWDRQISRRLLILSQASTLQVFQF
jgi:hypothetical protein